jgi:murein L,D-transpeptidase YcbB/YkuD
MKKILLLLVPTLFLSAAVDPSLLDYQKRYSVCHGKSNYQVASCLLNGNLNYANFRGDRNAYKRVSTTKIRNAVNRGDAYGFVMSQLPSTRRYTGLIEFIDHLYAVKSEYLTPAFKGNHEEDTLRMKRIFNLLQSANLPETVEVTPAFEAEVLKFQSSWGLAADGDIGARTKRAFQVPIRSIIAKVKKNLALERISRKKPAKYIAVNIPEFRMHYYENHDEVLNMKVVVGKTKMRTPVFTRKLKHVVLNPTWNVPPSIYKKEYAHLSTAQLKKIGLRYGSNGKLYQPAGRRNALGLVKFLFPNKFNVYMHDTPAKSRFLRTSRAYSHGCIRLEKPMDLLHKLGYSYKPGKTTWKTLQKQIPVFVEYHTAWIDDKGIPQLREDIYGYEKKLFSKPVYRAPRPKRKPVRRDVLSDF